MVQVHRVNMRARTSNTTSPLTMSQHETRKGELAALVSRCHSIAHLERNLTLPLSSRHAIQGFKMLTKIKKILENTSSEGTQAKHPGRARAAPGPQSTSSMREVSSSPSRGGISSVTAALLSSAVGSSSSIPVGMQNARVGVLKITGHALRLTPLARDHFPS